jgi:hypothetical protein
VRSVDRRTLISLGVLWLIAGAIIAGLVVTGGFGSDAEPDLMSAHGDGLTDSHDGFRIVPVSMPERRGKQVVVSFRVLNELDQPQTDYAKVDSKRLHLHVLRDDTNYYQHLYPTLDGEIWKARIDVADGGQYRASARFTPRRPGKQEHTITLGLPFVIAGDTTFVPPPGPEESVKTDGFVVTRTGGATQPAVDKPASLRFRVTGSDGAPVELDTHLGSSGYVTAYNTMTLAAVPLQIGDGDQDDGEIAVDALFDQRGEHRVFVEFRVDGEVHVAAFTVFAT